MNKHTKLFVGFLVMGALAMLFMGMKKGAAFSQIIGGSSSATISR